MKLVVGLGNPGKKYEKTRHNVGFIVISNIKNQISNISEWKLNKKFNAEIAEGKIDGEKTILVKPQTFMNKSGGAVAAIARFYKVKPQDILVIHDDIDLPVGKIRIKKDGKSGGHQGVQSIITALGTQNFTRLKIGVGPKIRPNGFDAAKFVLKKIAKNDKKNILEAIKTTAAAAVVILTDSPERAMNIFN